MAQCKCDWCESRITRRDFRQDHGSDGWEETPYRKGSRSNYNRRLDRPCKRAKNGEKCDDLGRKVKGSRRNDERTGFSPNVIKCCSRCGKEYYSWAW